MMGLTVEQDFLIYLIRIDPDLRRAPLANDLGYALKGFLREHPAGGVRR